MRLPTSQPSDSQTVLAFGCALIVASVLSSCTAKGESAPCAGDVSYVHVVTDEHRMWLCAGGEARSYRVRLGLGGVGKRVEGDKKVPLGRYPMSAPRASATYGLFIPIGYPTPAQRAQGFTGGAVGIHGPSRGMRWLGALNDLLDTTDGCIGLATDADMAAIADWVRRKQARNILIEVRRAVPP